MDFIGKIFFCLLCRVLPVVSLSLFFIPQRVSSQTWNWVKNATNKKANWSTDIVVSSAQQGKAFAGGNYYDDTLYWDGFILPPYPFSAEGGIPLDCYLLSIDNNSVIHWTKRFGGNAEDYLAAIDTDSSGNIYSVGSFGGDLYADNDTLPIYAPQGAYDDVFIIKHDSSGNLTWAKSIYGTWYERGEDIHTVENGFLVSGNFTDSCYFDSIAIFENNWYINFFLAKYSENGNVQWAINSHGKYVWQNDYNVSRIQTDKWGNIYVSGHFQDSIGFGSQTISGNGGIDIFLACFDSLGNVKWLKDMGGAYDDFCTGIHISQDSFLLITGNARDTVWFNNQQFFAGNNQSVFYAKTDTAGNLLLWKNFVSNTPSSGGRIAPDPSGNIYLSAIFTDSILVADSLFSAPGSTNFLLLKFREDTIIQWAKTVPDYLPAASGMSIGNMQPDAYGNLFFSGGYSGNISFDSITPDTTSHLNSFIAYLPCYSESPQLIFSENIVCPEDTVLLSATVKSWQTILWSTAETADTIYAANEGIYSVVALDGNGCSSKPDSVEIIHFVPVHPALARVCDSLFMPDTLPVMQWFFEDSALSADTFNFTIALSQGNYHLAGTDTNGCFVSSDTILFFFPDSLLILNRICDSLSVADSYETYSWYYNGNLLPVDSLNFLTAALNGNYSLMVLDSNGCHTPSDSISFIKADSIIYLNRVCDSLFTKDGFENYSWSFNGSILPADSLYYLTATFNGNYSLVVLDGNGCSIPSDSILFIKADSMIALSRICDSLSVPDNYETYSWFFNGNILKFDTLNFLTATADGNYSLSVLDSNGCYISSDSMIFIKADSMIALGRLCDSLSVPDNYETYSWYFSGNILPADSLNFLNATTNGNYSLSVADSNGCIIPSDSILFVKADSIITLGRLCDSLSVPDNYETYSWFFNGNILPADSLNFLTLSSNGSYFLSVLDSNGCFIPSDSVLFIAADSVFSIGRVCDSIFAGDFYENYSWYFNGNPLPADTLNNLIASANGNYSLTLADSNGCFIPSDTIFFVREDSIIFLNRICDSLFTANNFESYSWFFNGNILPGDSVNFITAAINGNYSLTVLDSNGCSIPSDSILFNKPDSAFSLNRICDSLFVSDNYEIYSWYFNGNTLPGDSLNFLTASANGNYLLSAVDSNGCIFSSSVSYISSDPFIKLNLHCDSLFISDDYEKYLWYYNGNILPEDSLSHLIAQQDGLYNLISYDSVSCTYFSDTINIYLSFRKGSLRAYPNPVHSVLNVEIVNPEKEKTVIELQTFLGEKILQVIPGDEFSETKKESGKEKRCGEQDNSKTIVPLDVSSLQNGIYVLVIRTGNESHTYKIVKL